MNGRSAGWSKVVQRALMAALGTAMLAVPLASPAGAVPQNPGRAAAADVSVVDVGPTIDAWGGRFGSSLGKVWVGVYVGGAEVTGLLGHPVVLQQLVGGAWSDRASIPIPADEPVRFAFPEEAAATLRVSIPAAGLVSWRMVVPAAPELGRSRYYVRSTGVEGGRDIVRVYEDGTAIGIALSGQEYRCEIGSLAKGRLTLKTFDFDGSTRVLRASGTWKNLKIRSWQSKSVSGPLKALKGKNLKLIRKCAAPIYAVANGPAPM